MRHALGRLFALFSLALFAGCACQYPPLFTPGREPQNYDFARFDPFPDRQAGPPLEGVRPPGSDRQRSEPVRSQAPYSNSIRGAVLVP